jgi:hypothetical protein
MICITCPILHEIVFIDIICNGYVLVLIEVELTDLCSDFTRNMFWLASCFLKIKKPNSHLLENQCGIASVCN